MLELSRRGIRLLDGETIESIFDSTKGTVQEVRSLEKGFLLTSKRLVYVKHAYLASWLSNTRSRAALLQDISYLETRHQTKAWSLLAIIGLVLFAGIFLAVYDGRGDWEVVRWGVLALFIVCTILGSIFWYSAGTAISTQIGNRTCKVKIDKSAEEDAVGFATSFFEYKSRV